MTMDGTLMPAASDHRTTTVLGLSEKDLGLSMTSIAASRIGLPPHKIPLVLNKISQAGECLLWTASLKENGYGQFHDGKRNWNAHRLVYLLAGKELADDLELDHLCRIRHCVNPSHLDPVTRAVNVRRQADTITHCPAGHAYDDVNTYTWRGMRHCRTCRTVRLADYKDRIKESR